MANLTIKTRSEVSSSVKRMMGRADNAMEQQNYGYACEILRNVLLAEPGFNDARLKLREAQLDKIGRKSSFIHRLMASISTAWPIMVKGPMLLKKDEYGKALDLAEQAMENDPTVLSTLNFLKRAAEEAGLTEIATNAMEIATRFHPKNKSALQDLADLYQKQGQAGKSITVLQKLQSMNPNSLEIQGQLKHATALAAMEDAQWETADSYRDLIKDKEKAQTLEQQERVTARDEESRDRLIKATLDKIEQGTPTAGDYRKLAELYRQNKQYDEAIDAYQKIFDVTGAVDPGIESAITDTIREKYDAQLAELAAEAENNPAKQEELQSQIKQIENERDKILLERMQKRVRDYPNEMQYRFELGLAYWKRNMIDEALNEFQHAQRNPQFATKARVYMAKCLSAKNLTDLAIERLQENMRDKEKVAQSVLKETLYDLASAYEKNGDTENALATWKELYNLDVNYQDVGQRLEAYYQKGQE